VKLDTITMDAVQARDAYMAYRGSVRAGGGSPEDAMLARGYRHLAMGHSLVDARAAIKQGGLGNDGFPRIAIARADTPRVYCRIHRADDDVATNNGTVQLRSFFLTKGGTRKGGWPVRPEPSFAASLMFAFAMADFPGARWPARVQRPYGEIEAYTIVPSIPAPLRPTSSLEGYHVLFESEGWHEEAPPAPRDPALLKHIGGDLYAVLAVWDLTELERAVIAGTRIRRS